MICLLTQPVADLSTLGGYIFCRKDKLKPLFHVFLTE